jgi:hypothetical protein
MHSTYFRRLPGDPSEMPDEAASLGSNVPRDITVTRFRGSAAEECAAVAFRAVPIHTERFGSTNYWQ